MSFGLKLSLALGAVVAVGLALTYETPPVISVQRGFRGTAMDQVINPRVLREDLAANVVPAALAPAPPVGPLASAAYKNVQVLGGLHTIQFTRLMVAITGWVAPKQGCNYCHVAGNFASDDKYTKIVARRMIQMVWKINADWKPHVAATGVTCYTCHRGNNIPAYLWAQDPGPAHAGGITEAAIPKNHPSVASAYSSLPYDPFTPFLSGKNDNEIRVNSPTALPTGDNASIKNAEWTYGLMMHFSSGLGVNCTYCHNSRDFYNWSDSTPQRATAWYGIRMVRNVNGEYLQSLQDVVPPYRKGPLGDIYKVNCATCHQGVYKPLFGVSMLPGYPELAAPPPAKTASTQ